MLEQFRSYYQKNELFKKTDKILLTVSGGKDSMAMLHMFIQLKLKFGVAHCNFQLRGKDAELDEQLVEEFTQKNNIPYYVEKFSTQEFASDNGISIQMAARELRYTWFEKVRKNNDYQFIATAHHKNDVTETMLINLVKGTGLRGLHGISNKNDKIIRPLLCFNNSEIDDYVDKNNVLFREDLSNEDIKYTRNLIRHKVIPELEKINPALIETLNASANQFLADEMIIDQLISTVIEKLFEENNSGFKIKIDSIKKLVPLKSYMYYLFRDYGFNSSNISDILMALDGQSGKKFYSETHQIIKDRDFLFLNKLTKNSIKKLKIESLEDLPFTSQIVEISSNFTLNSSSQYAYLDYDKMQFPMTLRIWESGDTLQPLGMKGNKKVSDFLIDSKVSVLDKQRVRVLEIDGEVLWLVGHRIDDKFKITSSTKRVLVLKNMG